MKEQSVIHHTFTLERNYPVTPENVFAALSDPVKRRRWLMEGGHGEVEHFETDFRVGGHESGLTRLGPSTPLPGTLIGRASDFRDIVPNKRVVISSVMTRDGKPMSVSLETFELLEAGTGTELIFTHQAAFLEGADGPAMREDGWRKLLVKLEKEM